MAQQLLTAFGGGIAAPSANRYGRVSPTTPEHVRDEFGDAVRVVLDGGESPDRPRIDHRRPASATRCGCCAPGAITRSQIEEVVGRIGGRRTRAARSGRPALHYAPATPLEIVAADDLEARAGEIAARRKRSRCSPCARRCRRSAT